MAALLTDQGRQRLLVQASQATCGSGPTYSAARQWGQTLAVDDNATGFAAGHTNLLSAGSITNEFDVVLDFTPTRGAGVAVNTYTATVPAGSGNFTHKRASWHDDTPTNVTTSSTTLNGGVDGLSLAKTVDFSMQYVATLTVT